MAIENTPPPPADAAGTSYLEWGAVLGGVAVAVAISLILSQFGASVGLSLGDPTLESGAASWQVLIAGLWVFLIALSSAAAGGYIAGRMRSRFGDALADEVEFRDGAHGLVVWAVSTVSVGVVVALMAALASLGAVVEDVAVADGVLQIAGRVSTIFAFATAAGAALGAAAAWQAAKVGGDHRDKGVSVNVATPRMFRAK